MRGFQMINSIVEEWERRGVSPIIVNLLKKVVEITGLDSYPMSPEYLEGIGCLYYSEPTG